MVTEPKAIILALRQIANVFDKEFLKEHKHSPVYLHFIICLKAQLQDQI